MSIVLGNKPDGMSWDEWNQIQNSANLYNNAEERLSQQRPIEPGSGKAKPKSKAPELTPFTGTPHMPKEYGGYSGNDPV